MPYPLKKTNMIVFEKKECESRLNGEGARTEPYSVIWRQRNNKENAAPKFIYHDLDWYKLRKAAIEEDADGVIDEYEQVNINWHAFLFELKRRAAAHHARLERERRQGEKRIQEIEEHAKKRYKKAYK